MILRRHEEPYKLQRSLITLQKVCANQELEKIESVVVYMMIRYQSTRGLPKYILTCHSVHLGDP